MALSFCRETRESYSYFPPEAEPGKEDYHAHLLVMVSLISTHLGGVRLREELESIAKPEFVFLMLFTSTGTWFSLAQFVAFFGPLIGLVVGFDSINREKSTETMSTLVSIMKGKLLAGVITIAIMMVSIVLVIPGFGLRVLGVVSGIEEVWRIFIYLVISLV